MMKCYRNIPHSLIPRPFPPPVVHRLQYGNTEGEVLGDVVTCDDIRFREGRYTEGGRGGADNFEALSCNFHCRFTGQEGSQDSINTVRCLQCQQTGQCKTGAMTVRHHPPMCLPPDIIARDQISPFKGTHDHCHVRTN